MPDFHRQRILREPRNQLMQIIAIGIRIFERDGKLRQQRAQPIFFRQRIQSGFGQLLIFRVGLQRLRRRRLHRRHGRVREAAVQLGGENKIAILAHCFVAPQLSLRWRNVSVKRSVDLHHVHELRQNFQRMRPALLPLGIDNALPILVRPSRHSHFDPAHG